jgi:hypothetical protein
MIIDSTYFIREIHLPGNVLSGSLEGITPVITATEKEVLMDLLGYELYTDMSTNPTDTRWARLINGHEYTIEYGGRDQTVKWIGLANTDKISLLAYFTYFNYMRDHVSRSTVLGEVTGTSENAVGVSPAQAMSRAWNLGADLYGCVNPLQPSAYDFLLEFEDDETNGYEGWIFTPRDRMNSFSI